jgi:hypothetical protein
MDTRSGRSGGHNLKGPLECTFCNNQLQRRRPHAWSGPARGRSVVFRGARCAASPPVKAPAPKKSPELREVPAREDFLGAVFFGRLLHHPAPQPTCHGNWDLAPTRDLNWPNSERGVWHLEALGNALGEVASTTNRPGGHGNEEKTHFLARSAVV